MRLVASGGESGVLLSQPVLLGQDVSLALVGVHALVFHRSVYGNTKALDRAPKIPRVAKVAACISLLLWLGLVTAGRSIAYFDVPENLMPKY